MLTPLFTASRAALERYLSYGTESIGRQAAVRVRRARGFGLIGLAVVLCGGFVPAVLYAVPELTGASLGLMALMFAGLALGFVEHARYIVPVTHAALGSTLAGVFATAIAVPDATEISVTFPMLLILVITYVLGVRAAFYWTLFAIFATAVTVSATPLPYSSGASLMTEPGLFACRSVALMATFAFAAAERRVADLQSVELEFLAGHDPLTGLLNRRAFEMRLTDALARCHRYGRQLGLIMIDLDGFKPVNDLYGHAVGDELLRRLALRIAKLTRRTDVVCRMGGDEFLVLVEDVQEEKYVELQASRLLATLMRPVEIEGRVIEVSASIGTVFALDANSDPGTLVRTADHAMYEVKSRGGAGIRSLQVG